MPKYNCYICGKELETKDTNVISFSDKAVFLCKDHYNSTMSLFNCVKKHKQQYTKEGGIKHDT